MTNQARFEITDWRTVCSELIDALDSGVPAGRIRLSPLARRARAALAEPVGGGPTDEELKAAYWKAYRQNTIRDNEECFLAALRAIYRWDRPAPTEPEPAPPAEGEVGELVAWLRDRAESTSLAHAARRITRAADLLERQVAPVAVAALARVSEILNDSGRILQTDEREALELARQALEQRQAAPVPVPVSERLPGPGDCDAEGRVWWLGVDTWMLRNYVLIDGTAIPLGTHWLPATALPLPACTKSGDSNE